jgi:trk system potassium uptake protein TrkA
MRSDANNIATSLLAKSFDVPHIIARMREPVYEHAYEVAGVDTAVRVADILLNQLVMEVEQPKARKIMELKGGKANIYAIDIDTNARSIGMSISDIAGEKGFPGDCVFMGIYRRRDDDFLIPRGRNIIQEDDVVFLVSTVASIEKATEYLTEPIEE